LPSYFWEIIRAGENVSEMQSIKSRRTCEAVEQLKSNAEAVRALGATSLNLSSSVAGDEAEQANDRPLHDHDPARARFRSDQHEADARGKARRFGGHYGARPSSAPPIQDREIDTAAVPMAREIRHELDDMQGATEGIACAVSGSTLADHQNDRLLRHALQRAIEIISETSQALQKSLPPL
jgi:hypothetical protein